MDERDRLAEAIANDRHLCLIGQQALRIVELEAEVKQLKDEGTFYREYAELQQKFASLERQHARAQKELRTMTLKYNGAKTKVLEWNAYHLKTRSRPKKSEAPLPSVERPSPQLKVDRTVGQVNTPSSRPDEYDLPSAINGRTTAMAVSEQPANDIDPVRQPKSSQSTVPEDNLPEQIGQHDDDEPEVVSERQLKRRRLDDKPRSPRIKIEPGLNQPIELSSDSAKSIPEQLAYLPPQSSDLSSLAAQHFKTPRLRRFRDETRAASADVIVNTERPRGLDRHCSSLSDGYAAEVLAPLSEEHVPAPTVEIVIESESRADGSRNDQRKPLSSISGNARRTPARPTGVRKRCSHHGDLGDKLAPFSEDGTLEHRTKAAGKQGDKLSGIKNVVDMLNEPSPGRTPLPPPSTVEKHARAAAPQSSTSLQHGALPQTSKTATRLSNGHEGNAPAKYDVLHSKDQATAGSRTEKTIAKSAKAAAKEPPKPLRSLPLQALRPHHFRVNHAFEGQPWQIADPIFTKDQRSCPPHCRNSECCGDVLRLDLDRAGGPSASKKSDYEVLAQYCGPDFQDTLSQFDRQKQKRIIEQAHAMCFADQMRKPRVRAIRPSTPLNDFQGPMPSTQEIARHNIMADEMAKRYMDERYLEARRPNGRWFFADE